MKRSVSKGKEKTKTNTELQIIRESLNLTRFDFAKLLGLTMTMYGRCENGRSAIPEIIEKKVMELATETQDISDPAVDEKTASRKTTVKKAKEVVDAAKDAAKSTARKAAKGAARKVAEKVVDDLVDIAVANAQAIPAEVSTPAEEKVASPTVEDFMPAPVTTHNTPAAEEKITTPTVEEKAAVEEKKPSAPKKTRKPSKKATSTPTTPATTTSTVDKKEAAAPVVEEKAAPKKAEKKAAPKKVEKKAAPKKTKKKTPKSPSVVIESLSGNQINLNDVIQKVPAEAVSIYVKPGENKAYWVSKTSAGDVELW